MSDARAGVPSRRSILRAAGAAVALPFLESALPRSARASILAARPPVRLGIFSVAGGTVLESWTPKTVGPLGELPSILRPLESLKNDLVVISGLSQSGRSDGVNAHEHCAYKHLTACDYVKKESGRAHAGISVDQAAARALGAETPLPSLELGHTLNSYSFRSADVVVPSEGNPRLVFDRMFRGRKPVAPNWSRRAGATLGGEQAASPDRGVLDLVASQAADLRKNLGRDDRRALDGYLESVRAAEKRIDRIEARHRQELLDLASPGPSRLNLPAGLPRPGTPIWEITRPMDQDPEKHADYIRTMADLMVLAFRTDTTRVATLAAGSDECMFPGVVSVGYERHCHTLEHQGNAGRPEDADPIAREACRQIHAWYNELFAETLRKLKAVDEGGSTLLDNSLILFTSYMADGGHGQDDYPVILAGGAGGKLAGGRHLAFGGRAPVANLYVEMLNLAGVPTAAFGDSATSKYAASLGGRLPGLAT